MLRWALSCLVLLAAATPVEAQVQLQWKFQKGQKFYLEEVMDVQQTITLQGQEIPQNSKQTTISSIAVLNTSPDGSADMEMKFESIEGQGANADKAMFDRMKGATFRFTLDASRKVTKFEGYDEFIKRVAAGNAQMATILKSILSEEALTKVLDQTFTITPDKPVAPGDKWTRKTTLSLGPIGSLSTTRECEYRGKAQLGEKTLDHFTIGGTAEYMPPRAGAPGLPFKITKGDLKFNRIDGNAYFDADAGRLVQVDLKLDMSGSLTIQVAGEEAAFGLQQKLDSRVRVLDKMP